MSTGTTIETTDTATDPIAAVEAPENLVEAPEADTGTEDQGEETGGNKEAAKYRTRLRAAEAERDALATRVQSLQRAEAERLAGEHLAKGAALWAGGTELADLLDVDGNLDTAKIATRAAQVREEYGIPRRTTHIVPREGNNPPVVGNGTSMRDVIMGNRT